jgi:argininosuccinate lyase
MAFSPDYVRLVLNENFEDAKALFLAPLMAIQYAHLQMLAEQGILAEEAARRLREALDTLDLEAVGRAAYDGSAEDLFFHIDRLLVGSCGRDLAGRLHVARSRNDIDMTMYRIGVRRHLLAIADAAIAVRRALTDLAGHHRHTIVTAHTHTQPAQPTTVAHYLLAMIEQLARDTTRLLAAYETTNRCPLGACAITGTGFPIDRDRTSALLGFDGPTGNTYGSIAAVDYLLESAAAASTLMVGLGRFLQDMLLWCTAEVGYLRLADGFVQISSIMPQKRNPVGLEHARALASKALAQLGGLPLAVHNTPFGDIVDTEDDLQPLVEAAFRDAARATGLVAAAMTAAEMDVARMRQRALASWITATELADQLAREHGVPFMTAHAIVGDVVGQVDVQDQARLATVLGEQARRAGYDVALSEADLARALSPDHFVAVRMTAGGPSPAVTAAALEEARGRIDTDAAAVAHARDAVRAADGRRWGRQRLVP